MAMTETEALAKLMIGGGEITGTIGKDNGRFGFITLDGLEGSEMFVMPAACSVFGGVIPPIGTRVKFIVITDSKTGRPRAENVVPADSAAPAAPTDSMETLTDKELVDEALAVFQNLLSQQQQQDAENAAGEVLKAATTAANMELANSGMTGMPGTHRGTIKRNDGGFGSIEVDEGGEDIFLLPSGCTGFGNSIPPVGTPVCFSLTTDRKKGLPLADNVSPVRGPSVAPSSVLPSGPARPTARTYSVPQQQPINLAASTHGGTIRKDNGAFGFINQDNGEDMFIMPAACAAFGGKIPPVGTYVRFDVVTDSKTGRPRAENVIPANDFAATQEMQDISASQLTGEDEDAVIDPLMDVLNHLQETTAAATQPVPIGTERSGVVKRLNGGFGFIEQDSGEGDMFFMPMACAAFGNVMPTPGTRVTFEVVQDSKTGRPRADNVRQASSYAAVHWQDRSQPY